VEIQNDPLDQALKDLGRPDYGRFTFDEQCGYYAALLKGVPPTVVAKISGMSQTVVSLLKGAGQERSGQLRYPRVAREYHAMGHEAFIHRYLTPVIRQACLEGVNDLRRAQRARVKDRVLGINEHDWSPKANRYAGRHVIPAEILGYELAYRIEPNFDRHGWFWRQLSGFQWPEAPPGQELYKTKPIGGRDGDDSKGFRTSEDCYRHVLNQFKPLK
jgi:hypothetical protein